MGLWAPMLLVVLAHLALLLWLSRQATPPSSPAVARELVGLPVSLSALAPPAPPRQPTPAAPSAPASVEPPPDRPAAPTDALPAAATPAQAASPPSVALTQPSSTAPPCPAPDAIAQTLQTALTQDVDARRALDRIPRRVLSVAQAVVVWDRGWVAPTGLGGATNLQPIQRVVLTELAKTRPACLTDAVQGPRLLIVAEPSGSTVLAIGSGVWAWGDLLDLTRVYGVQPLAQASKR